MVGKTGGDAEDVPVWLARFRLGGIADYDEGGLSGSPAMTVLQLAAGHGETDVVAGKFTSPSARVPVQPGSSIAPMSFETRDGLVL